MMLGDRQARMFAEDGFVIIPNLFCKSEIAILNARLPDLMASQAEGRIMEPDGETVRSVMGGHETLGIWTRFVRHPRLVLVARQLLGSEVALHQFKVNPKQSFAGAEWAWHQDFIFWHNEDGMTEPRALTAAVFLDDVYDFNGPLVVFRSSHKDGLISTRARTTDDWRANAAVDLKYSLEPSTVQDLAEEKELLSLTGPAGTGVFFHCNIVHASGPNIAPQRRAIAFASYTSADNRFRVVAKPRPAFVAARERSPVRALGDDCLTSPQ